MSSPVVTEAGQACIEPTDFSWVGKPSIEVSIDASTGLCVGEKSVVRESDVITAIQAALVGQAYTAGTYTKPGQITEVSVCLDPATLSSGLKVSGESVVLASSTGEITLQVAPALQPGTPPVSDPALTKQARITFDANQTRLSA